LALRFPKPDHAKIEEEVAAEFDARDKSLIAGNGEWKNRKTGVCCVYAVDRAISEEITVVRRNGTTSMVRLDALAGDGLYTVTASGGGCMTIIDQLRARKGYVSSTETIAILGMTRQMLCCWVTEGRIPAVRIGPPTSSILRTYPIGVRCGKQGKAFGRDDLGVG